MRGSSIVFLFLLLTTSLHAQEVLVPTSVTDSAVDDLASRRTTRPTQTVSHDELQPEFKSISDSLNTLPGVQARTQGSPTISIHGSRSSAETLVFADGAPLNFADGVGYNPIFVATENLDQVILLRGASSTLFGHDALAGALEFNSEKLTKYKYFESYGSFNTTQTFAGAPIKVGNTKVQITAYQTHSDGNFPYSSPRGGFSGTRSRNDNETVRATVSAENNASEFVQWKTYNLIARQIGSTPDSVNPTPFPTAYNNWAELSQLTGTVKIAENWKIATRSTFKYLRQDYFGSSPSDTQSFRQGISVLGKLGTNEVEVFEDVSFEAFRAAYFTASQNTFTLEETGVSDLIPIGEHVNVQPALRVSNETDSVVPSLGINADSEGGWKYFANYAEGYHPPSLSQLYSQSSTFVGNPNLASEHSNEFDLGVEKDFEKTSVRLETFYRDTYNLIENIPINVSTSMPQNVGHGRAMGADLIIENNSFIKTGVNLDYLYNVELDTNAPVPLSPKLQASVHGTKSIGSVSFTLQDTYWTDYYDTSYAPGGGLVNLYAWNTLDFYVSIEVYHQTTLKLTALNILNQPRELTLNYPEPQQSFTLSLQGYL